MNDTYPNDRYSTLSNEDTETYDAADDDEPLCGQIRAHLAVEDWKWTPIKRPEPLHESPPFVPIAPDHLHRPPAGC